MALFFLGTPIGSWVCISHHQDSENVEVGLRKRGREKKRVRSLNSCGARKDASNSPKRTETMFRVGIYKLNLFARKEIVYGPGLLG